MQKAGEVEKRTSASQSLERKSLSDLKGHLDRKLLTSHRNLLSGKVQVHEPRRRVKCAERR